MKKTFLIINCILYFLISCHQKENIHRKIKIIEPTLNKPKIISYQFENAKHWILNHKNESRQQKIVYAVNRTDSLNFLKMDSIILPLDLTYDLAYYLPFPLDVNYIKEINKIIYFSYYTQTFAAYEKGKLIITGPTNMGRKKDLTPNGLFYTNWKAKESISTFNDEWNLRWNFNILNKEGIGWHQYSLPGYPASHSCLRLQEKDAEFLYEWAEQWILSDHDSILIKGTPVIVFGKYDFNAPKPWTKLLANSQSIDITNEEIEKETMVYLSSILVEQKKRESVQHN